MIKINKLTKDVKHRMHDYKYKTAGYFFCLFCIYVFVLCRKCPLQIYAELPVILLPVLVQCALTKHDKYFYDGPPERSVSFKQCQPFVNFSSLCSGTVRHFVFECYCGENNYNQL